MFIAFIPEQIFYQLHESVDYMNQNLGLDSFEDDWEGHHGCDFHFF